jgi:hypothetical protein
MGVMEVSVEDGDDLQHTSLEVLARPWVYRTPAYKL